MPFTYYHRRQRKPEQSIQGELDAPDSAIGAVANVQVNLMLKRRLQDEGCFLDPEKYDPVKRLGHGGYARVHLCFFMEYFVHKFWHATIAWVWIKEWIKAD